MEVGAPRAISTEIPHMPPGTAGTTLAFPGSQGKPWKARDGQFSRIAPVVLTVHDGRHVPLRTIRSGPCLMAVDRSDRMADAILKTYSRPRTVRQIAARQSAGGGPTQLSHRSAVSEHPKRCVSIHEDPLSTMENTPRDDDAPPRQPSGSRSRSQSADQPQDLLEPVPAAQRRATLAPIFTSLSRRSATIPRLPRATPGSRPRPPHPCFYLVTPKSGSLAFYPGTQCPARPIPGIARRYSNVRRWVGPML